MSDISGRVIAVIGGREVKAELLAVAEETGRLIARSGAALATGGLGGVMEAASRGARSEGGLTIGVLPGEDKSEANRFIDVPIATGFGIGRNIVLVRTADALIAVGGQYGTLSEIAHALQMGKPIVGIGTWEIDGVVNVSDSAEAVSAVINMLETSR